MEEKMPAIEISFIFQLVMRYYFFFCFFFNGIGLPGLMKSFELLSLACK